MSNLALKVGGKIHSGWTEIRLRKSLEELANSFELVLTSRWGESGDLSPIVAGSSCKITIDEKLVLSGFIDDISPSYNATENSINVAGRSKTGDLIDCSGTGRQFKNQTLLQIAKTICDPFNIEVQDEVNSSENFRIATLEAGETYFEFLSRLATIRALRLQTSAAGKLVIIRTGKDHVKQPLELGNNILSANGQFSHRDRFNSYAVQGQQPGNDLTWGEAAAHISATATDTRIKRHRPTLIIADNAVTRQDCQQQSEWQRNANFGRGLNIVYTVNGWTHPDGLWEPNTQVSIKDHWLGIDDTWLISSVQFVLDAKGERTELQVMPKEAFDLIKLPESTVKSASMWGL